MLLSAGLVQQYPIPKLTEYEKCLLEKAVKVLQADIKKAERFVGMQYPKSSDSCEPPPEDWCNKPKDWCAIQQSKDLY